MTASQGLGILFGAMILSAFFALIYRLQEVLKVDPRQRLFFLKCHLVLIWFVVAASVLILRLNGRTVIARWVPGTEILNKVVEGPNIHSLLLESESSTLPEIFLGVYLVGVSVLLLRLFLSYFQMRKLLLDSSKVEILGRGARVSSLVSSPFSFGILSPQIFVPPRFLEEKSQGHLEVVLVHEETHVKNRDLQWKMASLLTKAAFFLAPSAHYLHRKLELEMEVECDRETMSRTQLSPQQYGNMLIDFTVSLQKIKPSPLFSYMSDTNLKRRIQAMKAKTSHRPVLSVIFGFFVLATSMTAIAATSGISKFKGTYQIEAKIILNGKLLTSPRLIVAPNEAASIESLGDPSDPAFKMEVIASEYSDEVISDGVDLKMAVEYKSPKASFRAKPHLVVSPGGEGGVKIDLDANDTLEMKFKVERL